MSREITVEISENAYDALVHRSALVKKLPEQIASEVLDDSLSDPLLQLAGSLTADQESICDSHDVDFGAEEQRTAEQS